MKKLWDDDLFKPLRSTVLSNLGAKEDSSIDLSDAFGLFLHITRKENVHVSASISNPSVLIVLITRLIPSVPEASRSWWRRAIKDFIEDVIQACFGYDILLIERRFAVTSGMETQVKLEFGEDTCGLSEGYVYHWIYEDMLDT